MNPATNVEPRKVSPLLEEKVRNDQEAVAGMKVFRRRLPDDNGWEYIAAKKAPGREWMAASYSDLQTIACRALTGCF